MNLEELRTLLRQMATCSVSEPQLSRVVQIARALCESHLHHMRPSIAMLCVSQGISIADLSYDCIAEAFGRTGSGRFKQIEDFIDSLGFSLDEIPAQELFLAFKAFLTRIVQAHLARTYALSDPLGTKIHRNIQDALKNSPTLSSTHDFRGKIISHRGNETLDHLEAFPYEELERALLNRASRHESIPTLLNHLACVLTEQNRYRRSIRLIDVVQIAKRLFGESYEPEVTEDFTQRLDGLSDGEIDSIRLEVDNVLKEKIFIMYFARGKLDRSQSEAVAEAFTDMLWDWCFSEDPTAGLLTYLERHTRVDAATYEGIYRTKMEYLLKIARNEFAARLMDDV